MRDISKKLKNALKVLYVATFLSLISLIYFIYQTTYEKKVKMEYAPTEVEVKTYD